MFNQLFFKLDRGECRNARFDRRGMRDEMHQRSDFYGRRHHHFNHHGNDRCESDELHHHCAHHDRDFDGGGFGPFGRGRGERGRGGHDRRDKLRRLFDHGDLRLVMLALLAKKPSHGYELIKAIEEATSGLYVPSPGVIYPTLTLLEEQEMVDAIAAEKGRKRYQITEAGQSYLQQNNHIVEQIFARLAQKVDNRPENLAEGILEPMHQLRNVLRKAMMNPNITAQQIDAINATLSQTIADLEHIFAESETKRD